MKLTFLYKISMINNVNKRNMKKKTDFTTDGFEVLGYFLLTAITVIVFSYITN